MLYWTSFRLNLKFQKDFKRLPKDGAYITISNHPLGGIDGILLLKLMLEKSLILKLLPTFYCTALDPMKPYIMPVNPFENHKDAKSSVVESKKHCVTWKTENH